MVGSYPTGGLFSLNELVHENGHAVHVSAIHTRPAYMDWPDTLFTEAFADVPSWSVHEPAWQRRYLGVEVPEAASLRALFGNVMLDVAWSLFEMRMLRDPGADPNAVWTDITSRYLRIVPHPELPWWAMRVQLASDPGYMVNYGLGAVLTAEMRARTSEAIGPFDAGNPAWYGWLSERLLRFGSERDTRLADAANCSAGRCRRRRCCSRSGGASQPADPPAHGHQRSSASATPCPTPTQSVTSARRPPLRSSCRSAVSTSRAPLAPERMPECDRAAVRIHVRRVVGQPERARHGEHLRREGLVDLDHVEVLEAQSQSRQQLLRRTHRPDSHDARRHAARGHAEHARARREVPARDSRLDATSSAQAPSLMPEALPAVIVVPGPRIGCERRRAGPSVVSGRGCSSAATSVPSGADGTRDQLVREPSCGDGAGRALLGAQRAGVLVARARCRARGRGSPPSAPSSPRRAVRACAD